MEGAKVKVEEEAAASSSSSSVTPQPLEGLNEAASPPFLTKTYEMVEDPATDSVVSWSRGRNSFIVWDSNKFSTTLLPRYFKHSNFSSFIRQLNTYGFRKVDPDRWEFANEGFLGGQKHLLKTIKRRRNVSQATQQQGPGACVELGHYGLEGELDRLKRDRHLLFTEILKLKQQQKSSRNQIAAMEARIKNTERKQQQMMTFLAKALNSPSFIYQFSQKGADLRQLYGVEIGRKRRLIASPSVEDLHGDAVPMPVRSDAGVDYSDKAKGLESELENFFSAALDDDSSSEVKEVGARSVPVASGSLDDINEKLLEELIGEDVKGDDLGDLEVDVQVEDWVSTPTDWADDLQDLVDQMGFLGSKP